MAIISRKQDLVWICDSMECSLERKTGTMMVPKRDAKGNQVLDDDGKPVMESVQYSYVEPHGTETISASFATHELALSVNVADTIGGEATMAQFLHAVASTTATPSNRELIAASEWSLDAARVIENVSNGVYSPWAVDAPEVSFTKSVSRTAEAGAYKITFTMTLD